MTGPRQESRNIGVFFFSFLYRIFMWRVIGGNGDKNRIEKRREKSLNTVE